MSDRNWWPDDFDLPAFRVQRQSFGLAEGGDYVRGSGVETLEHTALRYPTHSLDLTAIAIADRGQLFAHPFDHHTVELQWSWPNAVKDTFEEVTIVRSSFGAPSSPLQGQTVFRALSDDLPRHEEPDPENEGDVLDVLNDPPIIYDVLIPSKIPDKAHPGGPPLDGIVPNGRWYYYTVFFRTNVFDWTPLMSDSCLVPSNYHHAEHLWNTIPPYYQFRDDDYRGGEIGFLRQFLTILGFELDRTREYVESVMKMHWIDQSPMQLLKKLGENYGQPYEQGLGDIRYRALLANLSRLLAVRGTAKGVLELTETVSKYDCDLTYGPNTALLPDDSNFVSSIGHWAPMHPDVPFTGVPLKADYLSWEKVNLEAPLDFPTPGSPVVPVTGATSCMLVDTADANTGDIWIGMGCGQRNTPAPAVDTGAAAVPAKGPVIWKSWWASASSGIYKDAWTKTSWGTWTATSTGTGLKELIPYYTGLPVNPGETYGFSAWVKAAKTTNVSAHLLVSDADGQPEDLICSPPMLTPSTGTASTPSIAGYRITADTVWVFKIRKNARTSIGRIASKLLASSVYAWEISVDSTWGLGFMFSPTGAAPVMGSVATWAEWQAIDAGVDVTIAVSFVTNYLGTSKFFSAMYTYNYDDAVPDWVSFANGYSHAGVYTFPVTNTAPVVIGNTSGGTAGLFDGKIHWVEQRLGSTNPTDPFNPILWRFDANEWASGTTFTDARGKVWTLTNATAISLKIPILTSSAVVNAGVSALTWHEVSMIREMPDKAAYLIPTLYFDARTTGGVNGRSPTIHVAAAMVYKIESTGQIATFAADRFMTLGVATEQLGEPRATPPYEGYPMGQP